MIHRYNVHFEIDSDIEISVLVSTIQTDLEVVADYAAMKLEKAGLAPLKERFTKTHFDLLETLR